MTKSNIPLDHTSSGVQSASGWPWGCRSCSGFGPGKPGASSKHPHLPVKAEGPMNKVIVIGAGVGGLTTAAVLSKAGFEVTVLEAHVYPGGCAGTFYHQGFRFEAGATLAGGFAKGGLMDQVGRVAGVSNWPIRLTDHAMRVHLPGGLEIDRWSDDRRWQARLQAFSSEAIPFWEWQEHTADFLWDLTSRGFPWPPQDQAELGVLVSRGLEAIKTNPHGIRLAWGLDALRAIRHRIPRGLAPLRTFLDAQLLISAQTTSTDANALYAAAALDLPRRGVAHVQGGIGAIAQTLAEAVENHGGQVLYRKPVEQIRRHPDGAYTILARRGEQFRADVVIANLTPWNLAELLGEASPRRLRSLPEYPPDGWGAMMLYLGLRADQLPADVPLHQQVVTNTQMGEGNTIFLSLSPEWDLSRAPEGHRALTISTHTDLRPWWHLYKRDREAYETRKALYVEKILMAAEIAIPSIRNAAMLTLPGTPVTFHRFTRRAWGWVGGFPQTNLFRAWRPRIQPGLWMVGDSIFPGQSVAAVALGGVRVANDVLAQSKASAPIVAAMPVESNQTPDQIFEAVDPYTSGELIHEVASGGEVE